MIRYALATIDTHNTHLIQLFVEQQPAVKLDGLDIGRAAPTGNTWHDTTIQFDKRNDTTNFGFLSLFFLGQKGFCSASPENARQPKLEIY